MQKNDTYRGYSLPYCQSNALHKNGKNTNGLQRWYCKSCGKYFQREYRYNARKEGTYEKIIELPLNSSGVMDIGRVLKINKKIQLSPY